MPASFRIRLTIAGLVSGAAFSGVAIGSLIAALFGFPTWGSL